MNIEELLPFYALGALSDEESAFIEAYLAQHPERAQEVEAMKMSGTLLNYDVEPVVPAPQVKQALMARVEASPRAQAARRSTVAVERPTSAGESRWQRLRNAWALPTLATAGYALAALLLIWAVGLRGRLQTVTSQVAALQAQMLNLETANTTLTIERDNLERQLEEQQLLLAVYGSPQTHSIAFGGTAVQPSAVGRLSVAPNDSTAVLTVDNLAALPADQTYQFWLIGPDGPVSAGLLPVDSAGRGTLVVQAAAISGYDAIGVSVEPAGGSAQPTGDIVMLGEL